MALLSLGCSACGVASPPGQWTSDATVEVPLAASECPVVSAVIADGNSRSIVGITIDSCAVEMALDEKTVARLHLPYTTGWGTWRRATRDANHAWRLGGARARKSGSLMVFEHEVASLALEDLFRLEKPRVFAVPMPAGREGALGLGAFAGRAVVFDLPAHRVRFVPRAEVDALVERSQGTFVPARREGPLLVASVVLRTNQGTLEDDMVVDTGSVDSFLTEDAIARVASSALNGSRAGSSRDEPVVCGVRLGSVGVGNHTFRVDRAARFGTLGANVLLELGRPLLLDLEGGRVALLGG